VAKSGIFMRKSADPGVDGEADPESEPDLRSRTDAKRARRTLEDTLARLAKELVEQSSRRLEQLELPESVLDAVHDAQRITSAPARNRQLRVVRSALRDSDWSTIAARLEMLTKHGRVQSLGSGDADHAPEHEWVSRLVGGGSEALEDLLRECPNADRAHLRQLVRNIQKASAERQKKAEQKLAAVIKSLLWRA
jgi:ribosome-associated protein